MKNKYFGEVTFNTGWEKKNKIHLFNQTFPVFITAVAYFKEDVITEAQEEAYINYTKNGGIILQKVESLLQEKDKNASSRFTPQEILIERNGSISLLVSDENDVDNGIVVCIYPDYKILYQDEYL